MRFVVYSNNQLVSDEETDETEIPIKNISSYYIEYYEDRVEVHLNKFKKYQVSILNGNHNLAGIYLNLADAQKEANTLNQILKIKKFVVIEVD